MYAMLGYMITHGELANFESALITICRKQKIATPVDYWRETVSSFFYVISAEMRYDEDVTDYTVEEILSFSKKSDHVKNFLHQDIYDVSNEVSEYDGDCELCGSSITTLSITANRDNFHIETSYGCYGGKNFMLSGEEAHEAMEEQVALLFGSSPRDKRKEAKHMIKELKKVTYEIP